MTTSTLKIMLWDKEVGRLFWDTRRGISFFEYNPSFLRGSLDPFPLMASVKSAASHRPIMGDRETEESTASCLLFSPTRCPTPGATSCLSAGAYRAAFALRDDPPLDILSFIGRRGMGALEFVPESSGISSSDKLNMRALTDLAQRIFLRARERKSSARGVADHAVAHSRGHLGLAGAQPKAIIAIDPETGEIRSGQVAGRQGLAYCILKFGDTERSSAELEMAYHKMAKAAGISMMACETLEVEGRKHFVTRRFDREEGRKLHMQTLAALSPDADSYEQLLAVCRKMRLPESDQEEVFRRMVFNILANNTDDHNKNFSFLMDEKGHWRLAPAYDLNLYLQHRGLPAREDALPDDAGQVSKGKRSKTRWPWARRTGSKERRVS